MQKHFSEKEKDENVIFSCFAVTESRTHESILHIND